MWGDESRKRTLGIRERQILWERANHKCEACSKQLDFTEMLVGHKTAYSRGGSTTLRNSVCLCYRCNKLQGTDSWNTFLKKMRIEPRESKAKNALKTLKLPQLKYLAKKYKISVKGRIEEGLFSDHRVPPSKKQYLKALSKLSQEKIDSALKEMPEKKKKKRNPIEELEVIELKTIINTPEVPDVRPKEPEETIKERADFDLKYHFKRKKTTKRTQELYMELDGEIKSIDDSIWVKYAQTAVTYYSPEKMFVYLKFSKSSLALNIYTDQQKIDGVQNVRNHENWGRLGIKNKNGLPIAVLAIRQSFKMMKQALESSKNTGWYALTPRNKLAEIEEEE